MNEQENDTNTPGEGTDTQDLDDPRFEVKWRKKPQAAVPPAPSAADAAVSAVEGDGPETESLRAELEAERARVRELQDKWQRSAAEVANLRRRHESEKGDMEKMASMMLVYDLLPVVDNFQRALGSIPGNLAGLTWIQGVMLIERQLRAIFESRGVTAIEATGKPFDPHYHEAVSERETDEASPNTVLQEYQQGYTMHGYVIRPALVEVAKAPAAQQQNGTGSAEDDDGTGGSKDGEAIAEEAQQENIGP